MTTSPFSAASANIETPAMSAYRWLLILGFPENDAAASILATHGPNVPAQTVNNAPLTAASSGSRPPLAA